jgi:hypothetical protein
LTDYKIEITEILKENQEGKKKEIWANIINIKTNVTSKKRIWWKDNKGIIHDGTPDLPVNIRDAVDNAWIASRKSFS